MANKVRVTALFLVLAILIATFGAVSVVQAKTVGDVEKLEIIEEGQQTDCTLRWHRVKGGGQKEHTCAADGFNAGHCVPLQGAGI